MLEFFSKLFKKKQGGAPAEEKTKELKEEPLDMAIHVMPKRFMEAAATAQSSKSAGLFILIGGIALLLILSGGAYYYFFVRTPVVKKVEPAAAPVAEEKNKAEEEELKRQEETAKIEDAKRSYNIFKTALESAATFDDYDKLLTDDAEGELLSGWIAQKEKFEKLSESEKILFFELLKNHKPKYSDIEKLITGGIADGRVSLTATSSSLNIQIKLAKTNGIWKVISEAGFSYFDENGNEIALADWLAEHEKTTLPESEPELKPGIDTDGDGLTDSEEAVLGTKTDSVDSDADGYTDFSEFTNFYNPAGTGKLSENPGIGAYSDANFGFTALVPKGWNLEKGTGGDSLVFRSTDNQFLQIGIQPNANKEDILTWYKAQFEGLTPLETELSGKDGNGNIVWEGMKSRDGLTVYLTNQAKEYIFVLSFSPGEAKTLDYKNFLELMVRTFEFK